MEGGRNSMLKKIFFSDSHHEWREKLHVKKKKKFSDSHHEGRERLRVSTVIGCLSEEQSLGKVGTKAHPKDSSPSSLFLPSHPLCL